MEAPDFQELEWMAQQEFLDQAPPLQSQRLENPSDPPDFDELQWMIHQECLAKEPVEEDLPQHHSRPPLAPISAVEMDSPDSDELAWMVQKECPAQEPNRGGDRCEQQLQQPPHKRGKLEGGMQQHPSTAKPMNSEANLDSSEEWLPPPPSFCMDGSEAEDTTSKHDTSKTSLNAPKRRLADIDGDFMSITGPSGERVYVEVKVVEKHARKLQGLHSAFRSDKGLLSEPLEVLLQQVERDQLNQACRATEESCLPDQLTYNEIAHEQLWVEKYAPKSFTELLSDEQTNREVLRWLKQWDTCVFGGKKTSTSIDVFAALRRQKPSNPGRFSSAKNVSTKSPIDFELSSQSPHVNGKTDQSLKHASNAPHPKLPFNGKRGEMEPTLDRPNEKILLLCGPPGLGKTTLAHVAARHCGYRVVEINASDDRVATTLQAKILDAVQMKSVMGDMRPNCLVIDEIDGALGGADGKGAIDALLKIAFAERKETSPKENEVDGVQVKKGLKRKGSSAVGRLSRPVICICNDPFAPALRSLRQTARVHVFAQPSANRVVTRLKHISNLEGYKINSRALTALAEHTECDIRSCLNTLQFLKRKKEPLKLLDIASQVVGRKDMTSSAFGIWGEIFQKRKLKHGIAVRTSLALPKNCKEEQQEFLRLYNLISNHGEYELTSDGVYENLLHIQYHDSSLQKTVECLELLGDSEITSHHALRNQHFALTVYQPAFTLAIRRLIAQPERPYIEWPKTFQRYRTEHVAKQELLRSWMLSMQPAIFRSFTAGCLACDLVSALLYILSPQKLRPLAPQLLSQIEKEEISCLVDTMIGYGINYKLSKIGSSFGDGYDGQVESHGLVLHPPIHKLIHFKDYQPGYRLLSLALRQVLSHEVELETIRRESAARTARAPASLGSQEHSLAEGNMETKDECLSSGGLVQRTPVTGHSSKNDSGNRSMVQAPKPEKVNVAVSKKPAVDFFAQFKKASETKGVLGKDAKASSALAHRDSRPLLFKFNEGFTNAIRKPVLVRDFM